MAAPAPSPATTAAATASSSSSSSSASAATIGPPECPICTEAFECDEAADPADCQLPRTLPCTHSVCSACLIKLLTATPGRVLCPTCRADHVLQHQQGAASESAVACVRLIPQSADTVQLLRRSAQLEAALQEQQWVQVQQQQAQSPQPHAVCAIGCDCAEPATHWCGDCDAAWCATHDAAVHTHTLASHRRISFSAKMAARQNKLTAVLSAAGARLKATAASTVQQHQKALERLAAEEAEQRRLLAEQQRTVDEKKRQLDESRARLAAIQASAARLQGLSDIEAQQQSGSFAELIHLPSGASGLLASLSGQQLSHLRRFLGFNHMPAVHLLYRASRDGFKAVDFWRCCAGKGPTLTLVKVAGNGFIFGAYTPVRWPADCIGHNYMADHSGRTFLFSLVNAHGRPVKLRLKVNHRGHALETYGLNFGPGFRTDLGLMSDEAADLPHGCDTEPNSFELDHEAEAAAGLPPIPFAYDKTLLAGDDGISAAFCYFAATEIEVYQVVHRRVAPPPSAMQR